MGKKTFREHSDGRPPEWLAEYKNIGCFLVKKSLYENYLDYLFIIDKCIDKKEPIPYDVAKRFFALQQTFEQVAAKRNRIAVRKKHKEAFRIAIARFAANDEYLFEGTSIQEFRKSGLLVAAAVMFGNQEYKPEIEKRKVEYSFQMMVNNCIEKFLLMELNVSYRNNDVIRFFFDEINSYLKKYASKKHSKMYTPYKRMVVAAYLTISVGRRLFDSSQKTFTNSALFKVANNALRSLSKEGKSTD